MNSEKFVKEVEKQIGIRYALGGGQMPKYKGLENLDKDGNWVGFDCCGGIMYALKQVTGINLTPRNVPGMMKAPWVFPVGEWALKRGDLIFVDIPAKDINGDVMIGEDGYPVYGVWNHVMAFIGENIDAPTYNNIITTEGEGGDFRLNPKSKTTTRFWNFNEFKKVSAHIYENKTRYEFFRINWSWLQSWKENHN